MSMLSAAQASFAVRWETMDTMVCSIFSGAKNDACASVDLLRVPVNLEICADDSSSLLEIIPLPRPVVGSVVGGWWVVVV